MKSLLVLLAGAAVVAADGECGTACQTTETCCFDFDGCNDDCWECCIAQATFCVKPRGAFQTSTCCPKWTVGCTVGSVGCCDPATPWQVTAGAGPSNLSQAVLRRPTQPVRQVAGVEEGDQVRSLSGPTAYALFSGSSGLKALSIEVLTGAVSKVKVTGPVATYYEGFFGGSTRVFPWDPKGQRFVFADEDAEGVTVYTVDAKTGASTAQAVSAAKGYPVGLAWDAGLDALIVGTQTAEQAQFFKVNPDTGAAESLGTVARGSDESSANYYAAYLTAAQQGVLYRVGFRGVTSSTGAGVEQFSSSTKSSSWSALPFGGVPASTGVAAEGGFVSLAMGASGSLEAVSWDVSGSSKVLGSFTNAHAPTFSGGPLGYTASATSGGLFAGLACELHLNPLTKKMADTWAVYSVPLSGGNVTESPLKPGFLLGSDSVGLAGFGM